MAYIDTIPADILNWMKHSLQLTRDYNRFAQKFLDSDGIYQADNELMTRERIWRYLNDGANPGTFSHHDSIWYQYMVVHAEIEEDYYSNRITEIEFYDLCANARKERDFALGVF